MSGRSRLSRLFATALALVPIVSSACSFATGPDHLIENHCRDHSDCPNDARCDVELAACVTSPEESLSVAMEVTLGETMGGAAFSFPAEPVHGPMARDLTLPRVVNVIGNVRWNDAPVSADITFSRDGAFAGSASLRARTSSLAMARLAPDNKTADYAVKLVPNRVYEILIEPTGEHTQALPPLRRMIDLQANGDIVRFDIDYPAELASLQGVVGFAGGAVAETSELESLLVRAIEPLSGRVVSSTGVTSSEGHFEIRIDPNVTSYVLRITAGPDRPEFPTFDIDPRYLFPDADRLRILVPHLAPIAYVGRVERQVATGLPELVSGATVSLVSTDVSDAETRVTGTFRTTVRTGDDGTFEAHVPPGSYEVVVTPPADSPLGVLAIKDVRILSAADGTTRGQTFTLMERATFAGDVVTSDGRFMRGATVQATANGAAALEDEQHEELLAARYNRSSDAVTGENGSFALKLDIGTYDLAIKPPPESGFPWIVAPDLVIGFAESTVANRFEFGAPVPLSGTLRDANGDIVRGAEVRAYGVLGGENDVRRSVLIGRAISDEQGHYMLLLPSEI